MYRIIRHYQDPDKGHKQIRSGLTLEQAQAHCQDPETSSRTCCKANGRSRTSKFGEWFDGYTED
jgi:hypothetical protein